VFKLGKNYAKKKACAVAQKINFGGDKINCKGFEYRGFLFKLVEN